MSLPHDRTALIKSLARQVGFDLVGIAPIEPSPRAEAYRAWLAAGRHGAMDYLARGVEERLDLGRRFSWVRSAVCVALAYWQREAPGSAPPATSGGSTNPPSPAGRIARYAWGRDYHKVFEHKLKGLERLMRQGIPEPFEARTYSDTGPILERELAARAGLGWIGKHTLLIRPGVGSYFLLGELITSLELAPDSPMTDHCGTCRRCIEACPTAAIEPYRLDAVKCLSYQTLENRGQVPEALHAPMRAAGYIAGCDICQDVCPHNREPLITHEPDFAPRSPAPAVSLPQVLAWSEQDWDIATRGRAHRRARYTMWQRNAAIIMGSDLSQKSAQENEDEARRAAGSQEPRGMDRPA